MADFPSSPFAGGAIKGKINERERKKETTFDPD